jgi:chromosome segregation ATPase
MEEDEKTLTVVRKVVLAPTSKRFTEMETQIQQLHSTINSLTQRLEQQLQTGQQERDSIQKAVSALASDCRNSHIRLEAHEAGIANLQQHTGVMQTRVEDAEKGINQNTRRLMEAEDSISTLQDNYTSLQQNMDSITREFQQVKTKTSGAANTTEDTCETGVFISGIQEIMKSYNMDPRSDPVAVAGRLLKEIECFHAINRIYVADRAAVNRGRRHEARAVIVYLNSTFYKRQTTILLKKLFNKYKL